MINLLSRIGYKIFLSILLVSILNTTVLSAGNQNKLLKVWNDPVYQEFIKTLKPWVPPLSDEEKLLSTKIIKIRINNELEKMMMPLMSLLMQSGSNLSKLDSNKVFSKENLIIVDNMLRLSGNIFLNKNRLLDNSIEDFIDGLSDLGWVGFIKYFIEKDNLPIEKQKSLFNWVYTSLDIANVFFPDHPTTLENNVLTPFLKKFLDMMIPLSDQHAKQNYNLITNNDIKKLRDEFGYILGKKIVSKDNFFHLHGGLPGHVDSSAVESFSFDIKDKFPYLMLFYQPNAYRNKKYNCNNKLDNIFMKSKHFDGKNFDCNVRTMEFMYLLTLFTQSRKDGQKIPDTKETYEQWHTSIFIARNYGDLLEKLHPKLYSMLRKRARELIKMSEIFGKSKKHNNKEESEVFEDFMKKQLNMTKYDEYRMKDLINQLRIFLND